MHLTRLIPRPNGWHSLIAVPEVPIEEPPPMTAIEERQRLLAHMVKLVARGLSYGLFIHGVGGVGKSRTCLTALAEENIQPVILNSHVTPMSLYGVLYNHRVNAVVWIDDADAIFSNLQILGLLRSALWGTPQRVVTYHSTALNGLPSSFVFESRIIITANVVPRRNEAFRALTTRVDTFEMSATSEECVEQMRVWARRGYRSLSPEECAEVVEFIAGAGATRQLSLRLYEPSLRKREYAAETGVDWRELVRCQLDQIGGNDNIPKPMDSRANDLLLMTQAVAAHPTSVKDQESYWRERTNKSRASFFRVKREFDAQQGENHPA